MGNQVTSFFGKPHDDFLANLRKATERRKKRALAMKAVKALRGLLRIRSKETTLLKELIERLSDYSDALDYGPDPKLASHILKGGK